MKINTSQISMDASAEHKDVTGRFTQLGTNRREEPPEFRRNLLGEVGIQRERSEQNRQSQALTATSSVRTQTGETNYKLSADDAMERMVTEVIGPRIRLHKVPGLKSVESLVLTEPLNPPREQVQFSITSFATRYQYEKVSVHSQGSVQLADGRDIDFSLDLNMERESLVTESLSWRGAGGVLMDPLVFQFDCNLQSLANRRFQFDLDFDGKRDESFSLQPGSGFLALDLNNDKQINDGKELFGPSTGHGFQELALHDLDGNGWIDENDPVFSRLRIWTPGESGDADLISLSEAGVGAICLTHDKTAFQLKDRNNTLMGEVAANGFFLTEGGEVRPLQEIKLAINGGEHAPERNELGNRDFLRQMAAIRQIEIRQMARLQSPRRGLDEERNLLESIFPDWRKEQTLASVETRRNAQVVV